MHFPGSLGTKILIVLAELLFLTLLLVCLFTGPPFERVWTSGLLTVVMVLVALLWPRQIAIDQNAIRIKGPFGIGEKSIPWRDLDPPQPGREILWAPWMKKFGIRGETLVFRNKFTGATVIHTSRHPDRARLLNELKRRGITP
jgi:hypothetical protein